MQGSLDFLRTVEPFTGSPETLVNDLYISSGTHTWQAGEIIRTEQSEDDDIFLIVEGEVRSEIVLCNAYQRLGHTVITAGVFLGLYHFIEPGPHPVTMTAQTNVKAMVWQGKDFRRIIECDPVTSYHTALLIARQLYNQSVKLNTYLLDNICWGLP